MSPTVGHPHSAIATSSSALSRWSTRRTRSTRGTSTTSALRTLRTPSTRRPWRKRVRNPLDIRAPIALELRLDPVERGAVARRSLPAIAELREPFDRRLVLFKIEATDQGLDRISLRWRLRLCGRRRGKAERQKGGNEQNGQGQKAGTPFEARLGGQPLSQFNGFLRCVAGESVRVFNRFGRIRKIVERKQLKTRSEDGANFTELVPVARRDD